MDEYVVVEFEDDGRQVLVAGRIAGVTNESFRVPPGRHTFSLAGEEDYEPSSQTVWVEHTSHDQPCRVVFVKRTGVSEPVIAGASEDT
jgi:hypothetical protein